MSLSLKFMGQIYWGQKDVCQDSQCQAQILTGPPPATAAYPSVTGTYAILARALFSRRLRCEMG